MAGVAGPVSRAFSGGRSGPRNTSNCAIVLEDRPAGIDARMSFQSFEQEIEEQYALNAYQEYAQNRMPQPGYASYRGGNWSSMNLTLNFQADGKLNRRIALGEVQTSDVEGILIDMERKVRWFEALGFPLRRTADAFADRQIQRARAAGFTPSAAVQKALKDQVRNDPPIFLVVFGSFLVVRGYATNITLRWKPPYHPETVRPYACTVNLAIQRIEASYPTWQSIRNQAGSTEQSPVNVSGTVQLNADAERRLADIRQQSAAGALSRAVNNANQQ
jgi:hypothetical protein